MPTCANCGSFVSKDYVRVFTPDELDRPHCCPACPDKIRDNGKVRDARANRAPSSMDDGQLENDTEDDETFVEALT